jgi:ubiquinone/menaquinone biosynthesis C-methylase UbiE
MSIFDTNAEPILVIVNKIDNLQSIEAVDAGCGAGRHDIFLYRYFGDRLKLTCLDADAALLKNLSTYLVRHGVKNFQTANSTADTMPFQNNSVDCMFTFNKLHHYDIPRFLRESARILKNSGYLFIYTRLFERDGKDVSGRQSAGFGEKNSHLYTMETLKQTLDTIESFKIESIAFFAYNRLASLEQLLFRPRHHDGSNFSLYSPEELEEALKAFSIKIQDENKDPQLGLRFDENVLFIIKKE